MSSQTTRSRLSRFFGRMSLLALASAAGLSASGSLSAQTQDLLRVGAAKRSIQPSAAQIAGIDEPRLFGGGTREQFFNLGGYGTDVSQGLPDELGQIPQVALSVDPAARAVFTNSRNEQELTNLRLFAIQQPSDGTVVVLAMIDAIGAGNLIQAGVKQAIVDAGDAAGLTVLPENILFGQTHSHTAADLQGLWGGVPRDWIDTVLYPAAGAAAADAFAHLKPARLSFKQGYTSDFNNYRRPRIAPNAEADGTITLLTATAADGSGTIGSVLQYNAHPTSIGDDVQPRTPHAEYVLGAMDYLETQVGGTAVYFNGPIADASPSGGRPGCVNIGAGSADPTASAFGNVRCRGEGMAAYLLDPSRVVHGHELAPTLTARSTTVALPITNPAFLAVAAAGSFNGYYSFTQVPVAEIQGLTQEQQNQLPQLAPVAMTTVSRVTIGGADQGLEIVTIPGETTNTQGDYIRGLAKTNVMLLGLTHNSFGYILPEEEFSYVNPDGDNGFTAPFTGYEEFVSLGPLTSPLLRGQGWNVLFEATPDRYVPKSVASCADPNAPSSCYLTMLEERANLIYDYAVACLEYGPDGDRDAGAHCPISAGVSSFGAVADGFETIAEECLGFGGPEVFCNVFAQVADGINSAIAAINGTQGAGDQDDPTLDNRLIAASVEAQLKGCDMLDPAHCLFPFPSDHFTVEATPGSVQAFDPANPETSGTGRRVNLNIAGMPRNSAGKPVDPTEWNRNDGFSPGQMILTYVPGIGTVKDADHKRTGPITGAAPITDIAQSLADDAPIFVIDATTGERHPIWAEIDLNANLMLHGTVPQSGDVTDAMGQGDEGIDAGEQQRPFGDGRAALIIRPAKNFAEGHRYVVVLRNLKDDYGAPLFAGPAFSACRDFDADDLGAMPVVQARCAQLQEKVFPVLADAGVARNASLYLAWDFTVASAKNNIGRLAHMSDVAFNSLATVPGTDCTRLTEANAAACAAPKFTVDTVVENPRGGIARRIEGTITVPSFVTPVDPAPLDGEQARKLCAVPQADYNEGCRDVMVSGDSAALPPNRLFFNPADATPTDPTQARYGDGMPDSVGTMQAAYLCMVPTKALAEPARASIYGHGLLDGRGAVTYEGSPEFEADHNFMYCAVDLFGFAFGDIANVATTLVDLSNFPVIPDGSQQGLLNYMFLARAMRHPAGFLADAAFQNNGAPLFDRREIFYNGNSQGGIVGGAVLAISKDINRGILGSLGMNYSTLLQRSKDFDPYSTALYASYSEPLDRMFLFSMMQMLWDRSENNGYAHHLTRKTAIEGGPVDNVMLNSMFADQQVTPWSADVMARTMDIPVDYAMIDRAGKQHPDLVPGWPQPRVIYDVVEGGAQYANPGSVLFDYAGKEFSDNIPIGNVPMREGGDPHDISHRRNQGRCQLSHWLQRDGRLLNINTDAFTPEDGDRGITCPAIRDNSGAPGFDVAAPVDGLPLCMGGMCISDLDQYGVPGSTVQFVADSLYRAVVNADTDGDGVRDDADQCPNTPAGTEVDGEGCPVDGSVPLCDPMTGICVSDLDSRGLPGSTVQFVFDSLFDAITNADTDGDGVRDDVDECPLTPAGTPVAANGCPADGSRPVCDPMTGICLGDDRFGIMGDTLEQAAGQALVLPGAVVESASIVLDHAANGTLANRTVEPVVLTGQNLPGWSAPEARGVPNPYPSGAQISGQIFDQDPTGTMPGQVRDAHNGRLVYPVEGQTVAQGVPVDQIAAYAFKDGAWQEIPVQVDERMPYFLANANASFSTYSGTDQELSYVWDTESWGMTAGTCEREYDSNPAANPEVGNRGVAGATPDPVPGLDDDDEVVFMASDAGEVMDDSRPADVPAGAQGQKVVLADPVDPSKQLAVYLFVKPEGSAYRNSAHYVRYTRDANADQWIDRSFFAGNDPEILGTGNTNYGANLSGTVCPDGTPASARSSNDRFPRDGVTVTTDAYKWRASGRWMVRGIQVAKPDQPGVYGADLLDRWKGRAFQQNPDSYINLIGGFEDEQVNWEANSSLLGERAGPVRAIREVWGADSGTNVTKTETFYRDAVAYRYRVRVHPIPTDGLYTSWDYNRGAMLPTAAEKAADVEAGRYFTVLRPQGVPIDGVNDDIGNIDGVGPLPTGECFDFGADDYFSAPQNGNCPYYFDVADPTFNLLLAFDNWEQVSGKGDLGSLVYTFENKGTTSYGNPLVVPYYRDDQCFDDGTGDDPVVRPYPGEDSFEDRVQAGYRDLDGNGKIDCYEKQGAHASHGVHYFFTGDTDNLFSPVTSTEIDGQQWQFMVPTERPQNVAEPYVNTVRAPLRPVVTPISGSGGGQDLGSDYETCVAMAQEGGAADQEAAAKFACAVVFGGGRGEGEEGAGQIQGPNTYVEMPDGTLIATNVYVPWACNVAKNPAATSCPAILEMSGYESGSDEGQTPAGDVNDIIYENTDDEDGRNGQRPLPLYSGTRGAHDRYYKSGERYVSVVASVRGTGCSAGEFDVFSRKSAEDGKYLIDQWIAKQAWSNGKVGIFGHSYSGITGAMIASTAPEHLEVVSVSGQIGDIYRDIVYPGGVSNYGFPLLWTGGVRPAYDYLGGSFAGLISDSADRRCLQNQAARSRTTEDPLVVGLADTDTRWMQERSVVNYLYNVKAPTQIVTAYQDEQTGPRGGTHVFDKLPQDLTRRLVTLNGDHGTQTSPYEVLAERRYWLDRFLLNPNDPNPNRRPRGWNSRTGLPAPAFVDNGSATSRVLLEVDVTRDLDGNGTADAASNGHIDSSGFPLSQTQWTDFYFQADKTLDTARSTVREGEAGASSSYFSGSKRQFYSYQAGKNEGGAVSAAEADGADELVFTLNVNDFAQDYADTAGIARKAFVIAGPITAKLFLSATGGDTELMAQLIDFDPVTGERLYLQRGVLKASHRAIESQHSQCATFPAGGRIVSRECTLADNLYRPHRPHVNPETILPGVINEYLLEIFPVGHVLRENHQLLVKIHAPALDDNDWAYIQKTPPGINTLHHSAEYASSIRLPVIPVSAVSRLGAPTGTCTDNQMRCIVAGADPTTDYRSQCHEYAPTAFGQMVCNTFDTLAGLVFGAGGGGGGANPGNDVGAQTGTAFNTIGSAIEGLLGEDSLPQGRMLAGVGVVDMTPDLGYSSGQHGADGNTLTGAADGGIDPYLTGRKKDSADGVQGRMTGRAIVLEGSNGKRIALLKSDNYLAQDHLVRRVGQILAEQGSSIGYDQILYGVTHDHSSPYYATPSAGVWVFQDVYDPKFMEFQARRLAQAVMLAEQDLKPARLGATTVHHKVYKGNVTKPQRADDGTPAGYPRDYGDKGVVVMRIETDEAQPQPIAVWVNWGQHPEGLGGYNLQSADYVAHLERFVEREIGAPVVFSQGDVGSAENTGNDQQRIADDGRVCQGPGKTGESCAAGEGVWRDWYHKGFAQNERGGRFLADAVLKGWNALGVPEGEANPYVGGDPMANNYIASVQVPMSTGFPVDFRNAWVPGPLSHPVPGVSPCRTETTAEGNPGVPNAADCTHPRDELGGRPDTKEQMVWETLKEHGVPMPENYELPAFGTVEENLRLRLQAFRVGDIVLGSCACEAQVDLILNFESRANDVEGDIYDGFDWACVIDGLKDDPQYAAACETQKKHYDPAEYGYDLAPHSEATNRSAADIARMRAQVHNPADGWDAPDYVPYANAEPADPKQIKGNFTKEELPSAQGYKLAVGVGHAGDYNGYTVSYREYMAYDHYRKELTAYGPHTADYMVTRLVRMAGAMKGAPELKAEPHDTTAQADEARQVAASVALGQAAKAQYEAFYGAVSPDVGPAAPIAGAQPDDITWFQAATFTWRGGSTAVDTPRVVVQKKCDAADEADAARPWLAQACRAAGQGNYATFADQSGEVQTTVKWPDPAGVAMTYAGQQEWLWTANFEAFKAFPARLGDTPGGTYRFAVAGCINSLDTASPLASLNQRLGNFVIGLAPQLAGLYWENQSECRGGASPYAFESDEFQVDEGVDRVTGVTSDASGTLAITVADRSIPKSYVSEFFPYVTTSGDNPNRYCPQCSFRPWAYSAAAPVSVEVLVDGVKTAATGSGTSWNAAVGLAVGQVADITVTYGDGLVSRAFRYTRSATGPADGDSDGVPDATDNCPATGNADQADNDGDGAGNACDATPDGEGGGDTGPGIVGSQCDPLTQEYCAYQIDEESGLPVVSTIDGILASIADLVGGGGGEPPPVDPGSLGGGDDPRSVLLPASDEIDTASTGGKIYQIYLPSADNGEVIAFSVFEPAAFDLVKGNALVLQGHGYGLKRSHTPDGPAGDPNNPLPTSGAQFGYSGGLIGDMTQYVAANFWVISIDQRGFGESEGTVRLMDPDHEGRNLLQILDWAEANLPHLMYRAEAAHPNYRNGRNLVLGSTGGSYGGAYQNLILAIDPKERLDAMVPQITWHDLSHSLAAGDVTKSGYALGLAAAGEASSRGRQDPFVREQLIASGLANRATPELKEALRYHSLKYWCDGGFGNVATDGISDEGTPFLAPKPLPKVDVLVFQGMHDALFNIAEAIDSYDCLKARGGDVRLYTYQFGHVWPSGTDMASATPFNACSGADCFGMFGDYTGYGPEDLSSSMSCGPYKVANMELDWMKSKLQGDAGATARLATAPATCVALDSTADAVTLGTNPRVAPLTTASIPATNVVLNGTQAQPVPLKLMTLASNQVLAGIPKATITLSTPSPVPPQFVPEAGVSEPIVFVGLARGRFDYSSYCHQYADPYAPFAPIIFCTPVETVQAPLAPLGLSAATPSHLELIDDQIIPIRGLGTHTIDLQGVGERLAKGEQINLVVYGYHPLYVVSGSRQPATLPLQVSGSIQLPLQGNLPKLVSP